MLLCTECNSVGVFAFVKGFHGLIFICVDVKMANAKIKRETKVLKTETIIFMSCINMETQKAHKYFIFYFPFAKVARIEVASKGFRFNHENIYKSHLCTSWNSWFTGTEQLAGKSSSRISHVQSFDQRIQLKPSAWLCRSLNIHEPEKKSNKAQCLTKNQESRRCYVDTRNVDEN